MVGPAAGSGLHSRSPDWLAMYGRPLSQIWQRRCHLVDTL